MPRCDAMPRCCPRGGVTGPEATDAARRGEGRRPEVKVKTKRREAAFRPV